MPHAWKAPEAWRPGRREAGSRLLGAPRRGETRHQALRCLRHRRCRDAQDRPVPRGPHAKQEDTHASTCVTRVRVVLCVRGSHVGATGLPGEEAAVPGGHCRGRSCSRWRRRTFRVKGAAPRPGATSAQATVRFREGQGAQCKAEGPQGREMLPFSRLDSLLIDLRQVNRRETNLISYGNLKDTRL